MVKWLIHTLNLDPIRFSGVRGDLKQFSFKLDIDPKIPTDILLVRVNSAFQTGNPIK
jgi:hypothetical protein